MNIEKDLVKDGIIVTEKIDTDVILKITKSISKRIVENFPNFNLNVDDIFSKLFSLNMYKANMPEGMAEANYCYKNSSIYFNSHIANEDLEEFAIHECLHFLQEVKDENDKITPKVALILSQYLDVPIDYILGDDTFTLESLDRLKQLSKEDLKILNDLIVSDDLVAFLKGYNAYKENLTK